MRQQRHRLAQRRKTAGYSQEQLAEVLGIDRSTIVRWERGETEPQPSLRPKLAAALALSHDDLDHLLTQAAPDEPANEHLAYAITHPSRVDRTTVRELHERVAAIGQDYEVSPAASLLAEAGQCHALAAFLLHHAGCEDVRRALLQVSAVSATLMSQLIWDASQRRDGVATIAYCQEAVTAADACGDLVLAANARLRQSFVSLYGRDDAHEPRTGLVAAEAATTASRPASRALTGLSLLHVGEALTMLGEYRRCEQALASAEAQLEAVDSDDAGISFFSPTQLGRLTGSCYLFLGHPERAEPVLTETAAALADRPKSRSLVLGNLALAHLRQRQLDAATATLHEAIDLIEQTRGGGGMSVVFGAGRELYPWRAEPVVQDVIDRLLAVIART